MITATVAIKKIKKTLFLLHLSLPEMQHKVKNSSHKDKIKISAVSQSLHAGDGWFCISKIQPW